MQRTIKKVRLFTVTFAVFAVFLLLACSFSVTYGNSATNTALAAGLVAVAFRKRR